MESATQLTQTGAKVVRPSLGAQLVASCPSACRVERCPGVSVACVATRKCELVAACVVIKQSKGRLSADTSPTLRNPPHHHLQYPREAESHIHRALRQLYRHQVVISYDSNGGQCSTSLVHGNVKSKQRPLQVQV